MLNWKGKFRFFFVFSLVFGSLVGVGSAAEQKLSKDHYNIFNPTPRDEMRDFNPDRPGITNTPYTIDAGHVQFEVEFVNYSYSSVEPTPAARTTTEVLNYPAPNFRVGLMNDLEVQVSWTPWVKQIVKTSDEGEHITSGNGDLNFFFKQNVLGNEGGDIAIAIMPGIKAPTNTRSVGNKKWEPTLMLPLSFNLPKGWNLTVMPEIDVRKNSFNNSMHTEFNSPYTFGHKIAGPVDGYVEYISHSSNETGAPWTNFIGAGLVAKVTDDMQIDVGSNFGMNSATPRYNPFAGWTYRY